MNYDKEKLKIGYKGKFVIQDHDATNRHWDLRLEFPVESLKNSLESYNKKRVWENNSEPKPEFPDKAGTVLRSWAIPKHTLPKNSPLLATETEDHDIKYINFSGTISEGNYGAGTVKVYDKGMFELVDVEFDKKYVVKFNGKKVKGFYALIKTASKKFLWIKVKDISKYKKSNLEKVISQILGPLKERRDYAPHGKDMLEQNAEILKKKKRLSKELEDFFKNRTLSLSKGNEIGLSTFETNDECGSMFEASDVSSELIVNAIMNEIAIIKRCPKKNLTDDRPKSEQRWCLFDSEGERLLGSHPTKEKALDQERVIQIHKHMK